MMSMLGKQEALDTSPAGEWELVGRDMIRTKRAADGSGGMIVAQFWTAPTPEHAALMVASPQLARALRDVVYQRPGDAGAYGRAANLLHALGLAEARHA